jgi:hypothetical protein
MTVNVTLSREELAQIKQLTKLDDEAAAVGQAAREYVRLCRLRELKEVSGKVEFDENWQELEFRELNEIGFPN